MRATVSRIAIGALLAVAANASSASRALAAPASGDEIPSLAEVCQWLQSPEGAPARANELTASTGSLGFWDALRFVLSPSSFVELAPLAGNATSIAPASRHDRRAVVFTLGRVETISPEESEAAGSFHLDRQIMNRTLEGLRETRSVAECLNQAARWGFSSADIRAYMLSFRNFVKVENARVAAYNYEKASGVTSDYRRIGAKLEVVPVDSFNEIEPQLRALSAAGPLDVVLELHADREGRLYDQRQAILPRSFFGKLRGRAATLSLYSCYPAQVAKYYGRELATFQSDGVLVFLPTFKGPLESTGASPLGAFAAFLALHAQMLAGYLGTAQTR